MVFKTILKKISPGRVKKEIETTQKVKLPSELQGWIKEYEKVGERDEFVWKLFLRAKQETDCVPSAEIHHKPLREVNFLITMFVVLLDDIADHGQNERLFNEVAKIVNTPDCVKFNEFNQKEKDCLFFIIKIWQRINQLIINSPRYEDLKDLFKYDVSQIINAMNHDRLINKNYFMINKTDYWLYSPHTMQFVINITANLMYSEYFDINEIKTIREIVWRAQKMARIGNCISTWEREVNQNDFTSGIIAYSLDSKILSLQDIMNKNQSEIIKKIKESDIENEFLQEWEKSYKKVFHLLKKGESKTINGRKLLSGMKNLLALELISKKHK